MTAKGEAGPLKLFFDGGCRPNPGMIETAVVARGQIFMQRDIGHGSNGDAEWLALLHALRVAHELGADDIVLIGDAAMVVDQASGATKCRSPYLRTHLAAFQEASRAFKRVRVRRVGRHKNLAGIALARAAR